MKLFISYPSEQRELAERLRLALEAEGHDVFTDRAELRAGEAYHAALREAIEASDAFVFLITPRAVAAGSYTLAELDLAMRRWRRPSGHVLPVLVQPTPMADIPPYLRAVTLLQPQGDAVAEVVAAVARWRSGSPPRARRVWAALALLAAVGLGVGGWWWQREQAQRLAEAAAQQAEAAAQQQAVAALGLCDSGSHQTGWDALSQLAHTHPRLRQTLQDCGMTWLRGMRSTQGKLTFASQVGTIEPVLIEGLADAVPARRATLRAHIGWGEFLRSRDGIVAPDPTLHYRQALADDPGNAYAHAMWAHRLMTLERDTATARRHFDQAVRSGTDRGWVRQMQWGAATWSADAYPYAIEVLNQMRLSGDTLPETQRQWLWSQVIFNLPEPGRIATLLKALPPGEWPPLLAWAFPTAPDSADKVLHWRFAQAVFKLNAGSRDAALTELKQLKLDLASATAGNRLRRAVDAMLR